MSIPSVVTPLGCATTPAERVSVTSSAFVPDKVSDTSSLASATAPPDPVPSTLAHVTSIQLKR